MGLCLGAVLALAILSGSRVHDSDLSSMLILFFPLCGLLSGMVSERYLSWFTGIVTVLSVIYTMYYYAHLFNNYYDADPYRFSTIL